MKDIFLGHLAKTENKSTEEIAKLLYKIGEDGNPTDDLVDNAAALMAEWDKDRVKKLRSTVDNKKALEDKYKQGKKEALTGLEKLIKEAYKIESDKTGLELIQEIVSANSESDLEDDKVKRHPSYLDLEKRLKSEVETLVDTHKAELAKVEGDFARKWTLADVKDRAKAQLDELNPILPEDPKIANTWRQTFADAFDQFDFEKQEDGSYLVLKGDKRLEDDHGNPVGFDQLVKTEASRYFQFKKQDGKGSAGNKNSGSGQGDSGLASKPKNASEAWEVFNNPESTEDQKKAALAALEEAEGPIAG